MLWKTWLSFTVITTALCLYPGPTVLLVLSQGLSRGARASLYSSLGIIVGDLLYFTVSATSLGAFLLASTRLFTAVKWVGGACLVWMGLKSFFGKAPLIQVRAAHDRAGKKRLFAQAFFLQLANPKALLFFTAFLPQFLDPRVPLLFQIGLYGATCTVINFAILWNYGTSAERMAAWMARPGFARMTERLAGAFLILAGVGLSWLQR